MWEPNFVRQRHTEFSITTNAVRDQEINRTSDSLIFTGHIISLTGQKSVLAITGIRIELASRLLFDRGKQLALAEFYGSENKG